MKKILLTLLSIASFGIASYGQCITATNADYISEGSAASVSATGGEATLTLTNAGTYSPGLRWNFTSTDISSTNGNTNVTFTVKLGANPLSWTGTGTVGTCNTNGHLGIFLIDDDYTYAPSYSVTEDLTASYQTITAAVDITAAGGFDPTKIIGVIIFVGDPCAGTTNETYSGQIVVKDLKIGNCTSTGVAAAANIASSKLYPNPVSDMAKVELNLKSASAVKVVLSDVMGKEVMTIADGTFSDVTKEFSVANLNKGIYTVNYYINGEAAKAELLMVK